MPITINGSGTITGASTLATTVASPTLTTPNINSAPFATVSGTAPIYPCRAWVNFDSTATVTIRASGNVTSITDNGVGDFTINFTTAMPDTNYALVGYATNGSNTTPAGNMTYGNNSVVTTTSITVKVVASGVYNTLDSDYACVAIFR